MKQWYNNLVTKYPLLKYLSNKYVIVLILFSIWMLFLDNTSYLVHRDLNKQINELETNKEYYQEEIAKDKQKIKKLQDLNNVEHYAREKYYMKRDSEDIYIIEYEQEEQLKKDSIAKLE